LRAFKTIEVSGGDGLSGGGTLANDITISHGNTSSQANVVNSGGNVIQTIELDQFGHVVTLESINADERFVNLIGDVMSGPLAATKFIGNGNPLSNLNASNISTGVVGVEYLPPATTEEKGVVQLYDATDGKDSMMAATANAVYTVQEDVNLRAFKTIEVNGGDGLSGGGTLANDITISHGNTSSQANVVNSAGNVIQTIKLDRFGHIVDVESIDADERFVNTIGDVMSGPLTATKFIGNGHPLSDLNASNISTGIVDVEHLPSATREQKGVVMLHDTTANTSNAIAATANAVYTVQEDVNLRAFKTIQVNGGDGLSGGGTLEGDVIISHGDTSTQGNVVNSEGNVIQTIELDQFGHIVSLASINADKRFVNLTGDVMSGPLTATKFIGNGNPLSDLNASNISTGIVDVDYLPSASTGAKGVVQLHDDISSGQNVTNEAATANALYEVQQNANSRLPNTTNITVSDGLDGVGSLGSGRTR
jgi:hypothetical protein